ncbi:MAG: DsbA family protein [Actinobacteria bacterium]|nr:DsbA family protein [Actinomycetota bacterium]
MSVQFFYDLGSPYAYLTAWRIDDAFGSEIEVEWIPVLLGGIFKANGRSSWAETPAREEGMAEVERRGADYGLPPFVWPGADGAGEWPNNGLTAMRVATWAHREGAGREFAMAGFFEQFSAGRDLSEPTAVAAAIERAGFDVAAASAGAVEQEVKDALRANTERALELGVIGVPSVAVERGDGERLVLWGDDRLDEAVAFARG